MICNICKKNFISLDSHHIRSKSKGGSDRKSNITKICPNCHRLVHKGQIILEGKFSTTDGIELIFRNKNEESITGISDPEVFIY